MTYPNLPPAPPPPAPAPDNLGSTNVAFNTRLRMDLSYFTTPMGILRIIIALLNSIGAICIASSSFSSNGRGVFFTAVALSGLSYTLLITYAYTFHAVEKFNNWKWLKIEMGVAIALVILNMVASTIVVAFGSAAYSAAGLFGYLCMVSYGGEVFLRGRARQRGEPPQGHVVQFKHAPTTQP